MSQDAANGFLSINQDLTYQAPEMITDGAITYTSFKPQTIGNYTPGQTIEFKLRSTNEFVILDRSYMKFTLQETGSVQHHTSGTLLSSMGAQACISQIQDTISGLQLPVIKNYNLQQSIKLNTDTYERKAITGLTEGYSTTGGAFSSGNKFPATPVCIPVPTGLSTAGKIIPLSVLNGGWNISLLLESYNKVFQNGAVGNSYQISDIEIVCCMIQPDAGYLSELSSAMSKGGSLKLPLQLTKNITNTLAASSTQSVRVQCGYLSSLNSITNVVRQNSVVGQATVSSIKDSFITNTAALSEYYYMINAQRYPRNKSIRCGTDPENLYQLLAAFNTKLSSLTPFTATTNFAHYCFESNGGFASGISVNDGYINIETTFGTTPTAGDICDTFLEYSAVLVIDAQTVNLITDV